MNAVTENLPSETINVVIDTSTKRKIDPILQELYDVKAQLNKEANYSVANVVKRAIESAARYNKRAIENNK